MGGQANENTVELKNVSVSDVFGGDAYLDAKENMVTVSDSYVSGSVYGGSTSIGGAYNNTVAIIDSTVRWDVFAGCAAGSSEIVANVENNKVILKGATIGVIDGMGGNVIGGGTRYNYGLNPIVKNNTLEVIGKDNKVVNIKNFDNLNFYITKDLAKDEVMLKVTGTAAIDNAKVNAGVELGSQLTVGDTITLIEAKTLNAENITPGTFNSGNTTPGLLTDGLLNTNISIDKVENKLVATIDSISEDQTTEDAKSPLETRIAMLSILNNGSDLLASAGLENAANVVEDEFDGSMHPFITMSRNKTKVNTGSHIDLNGYNMNLGFAKQFNNNAGKLLIAPVIEYGRGSYDSYLDNGTHGEGDAHFWGAGLIAKQTNEDGLYYEGSLRLGKASTDYKSAIAGGISYDSDATYYAAHAGLGKIVTINDSDSLDYYGKLFYTRQQGDKVTVGNNATYDFDATTSLRSRIGARYTHKMDTKNAVYAGLAWQHEFDGEANAIVTTTLDSGSAPAPSVKGDTGIMELGWTANSDKLELGLGVNGSVGKQKGVGFTLKLDFKF